MHVFQVVLMCLICLYVVYCLRDFQIWCSFIWLCVYLLYLLFIVFTPAVDLRAESKNTKCWLCLFVLLLLFVPWFDMICVKEEREEYRQFPSSCFPEWDCIWSLKAPSRHPMLISMRYVTRTTAVISIQLAANKGMVKLIERTKYLTCIAAVPTWFG